MRTTSPGRQCTVYRAHEQHESFVIPGDQGKAAAPNDGAEPDGVSVRQIMARDLVCARPDLEIARVTDLMVTKYLGCLPIVDEQRHPIGIITRTDLAEQLNVVMRKNGETTWRRPRVTPRVAEDIMMPVMFSLGETATIADAASLMMAEDTHHILVLNANRTLVGVVSSKDIVGWVARHARAGRTASDSVPPTWRPLGS